MTDPILTAPSALSRRILVLASYQYLNYGSVVAHLTSLIPASFTIGTQMGVGHGLLTHKGGHLLDVSPLKWQPTRPHLAVDADSAVIFWDGHDRAILASVAALKRLAIPTTIIGPDGNSIDLAQFCATLTNGNGGKVASATATTSTPAAPAAAPAVIVDPPSKDSKVRIQLHLPEAVAQQYESQAKLVKQSPEKVMSDRLRTCVDHTSGRGLYFNDEQRAHLERITGGHIIADADSAIEKVRIVVQLKVADVTIELTERVLARATARAKSERKTLAAYLTKEVIQGLERSVGIRPW